MKPQMKIFLIMLISIAIHCVAGPCDYWNDNFPSYFPPTKSGTYTQISSTNTYSDGTIKSVGKGIMFPSWEDTDFYKQHWISCSITDIEHKSQYNEYSGYESCYVYTINCSVSERTQFYAANVSYTTLQGYRDDGTRKWSRDEPGSTDISCYNNTGMYVTKRVNDPYYCK